MLSISTSVGPEEASVLKTQERRAELKGKTSLSKLTPIPHNILAQGFLGDQVK